jgi:hypothetical protein
LQCLVNCGGGIVVLSNEGLVLLVLLLSKKSGFSQDLSVFALVGLDLGNSGLQLLSSWLEEVLEDVITSLDINDGV